MTVKKRGVKSILGEAAMLGVCIIFFIPFYYLLVNTFKPAREATVSPLSLPVKSFTLDLYKQALNTINFWSSFRNSILITVVSVVIIISIGSMASYAISRRKNKLTQFLFFYFLIGFMVPVQTTLIPLFNLMSFLKLQNSVAGMIVLYSSWCNFAMFMYQGFLGGVPKDLEEAALIDGANLWKLFWKIVFPLLKPVTTTIVIFDVMWIWNDYLLPSLIINKPGWQTLPLKTYLFFGQFAKRWDLASAGLIMCIIPIIIFYLCCQKYIVKGITDGAIK